MELIRNASGRVRHLAFMTAADAIAQAKSGRFQAADVVRTAPNEYSFGMRTDIHMTNITSPVGFTEVALDALRAHEGVIEVTATADPDGRYRDVWLRSTMEAATRFATTSHAQD